MKAVYSVILSFALVPAFVSAQVAINTDGATPVASAMLEVSATDKGMLIPRLTAAQRDAISSPATGLMVYVTDDNTFHYFNGAAWTVIGLGNNLFTSDGTLTSDRSVNLDNFRLRLETPSAKNALTLQRGESGSMGIAFQNSGSKYPAIISVPATGNFNGLDFSTKGADTDLDLTGLTLRLTDAGTITLPEYGQGNVSGTTAKLLAVTSVGEVIETDPQTLTLTGNDLSLSSGGSVTLPDDSASNEIQTLSRSGTTVSLSSGGGSVDIADGDSDSANELQNLGSSASGTNRTVTITNGTATTFSVADSDNSSTNELQYLSLDSGSIIRLTNGGSVTLPDNSATNELDSKWTASNGAIYHNDGSVGIGVVNPGSLLHIGSTTIDDTTGFRITQGSNNSLFSHNTGGDLVIGKLSATNQLVLDAGSSVGIGTDAPSQKLDVNGQLRIRGGNPGTGKVLTSSDNNGNAVWSDSAPVDFGDNFLTTEVSPYTGSGWSQQVGPSANLQDIPNGATVLVMVSFRCSLKGNGSGSDDFNFRIKIDNGSAQTKTTTSEATGWIETIDQHRDHWQHISFQRVVTINFTGTNNIRCYLTVNRDDSDDALYLDDISVAALRLQ